MRQNPNLVNAKGLTLLEVLVTLSVVSIGLLSMASLQLTGIRSVNSSSFRTQASIMVNDLVERMRANPTAVNDNLFRNVNSTNLNCNTLPAAYCSEYYSGTSDGLIAAASCNTTELATYDLNVWFCGESNNGARADGVRDILPSAQLTITCDDTNPPSGADADVCTNRSPHSISLRWTEINPHATTENRTVTQTISMTFQPE